MKDEQTAQHIELSKINELPDKGVVLTQRDFGLVKNVSVELEVLLGQHAIEIEKLFSLRAGEVLKLDKDIEQPIELRLNNDVVAVGNLVAIDGCFGIEISEIKGA